MQQIDYNKLEVVLETTTGGRYYITDNLLGELVIKKSKNESTTCEFTMRRHNVVNTKGSETSTALTPQAGDGISVIVDGYRMFYGWVTDPKLSKYKASVTANDQLFYLAGFEDAANFGDTTLRNLVVKILNDYKTIGKGLYWGRDFDNTGYTLPQVVMDGDSLLGVIRDGIDKTFKNTGGRYYLIDEYKNVKLLSEASLTRTQQKKCIITPNTILGDYEISTPITSLKTKYKVVQDNEERGSRTTFEIWNNGLIKKYGLIQGYEKAGPEENPKTLGTTLFNEYSRIPYNITVNNVIGAVNLYPGAKIWFDLYSYTTSTYREGYRGYARVESVTHRFKNHISVMDLELTFVESA